MIGVQLIAHVTFLFSRLPAVRARTSMIQWHGCGRGTLELQLTSNQSILQSVELQDQTSIECSAGLVLFWWQGGLVRPDLVRGSASAKNQCALPLTGPDRGSVQRCAVSLDPHAASPGPGAST